ncbi:glutamic-type intramembrane protease PrsW [Metabacillus sp. RGM 3146]|uniref:glutamic-type intramembrane protease PrsW n=1 Tax=Metabacillus sp. RGM 3146 TaxID=3401092 RepID=UPI003B9BFBA5
MFAVITAGIAPGLALLCYFYLKDQLDREPLYMVIRSFIFGMLIVFPIMFIQYVLNSEKILTSSVMNNFLANGFLEEFVKWFILMITIYQHTHFDEHYDGIVYGASVSLGFATLENIFYLFSNGLGYAFGRALLPVSSHALFGVIMGYYIGKGKFSFSNLKYRYLSLSFLVPFFLHGSYDYILSAYVNWQYVMLPFMIFLWWFAMQKVKKARMANQV